MKSLNPTLTSDGSAGALLAGELPGFRDGQWEMLSCAVEQSRRRFAAPGGDLGRAWLEVVWRLEVRDRISGAHGPQWLYGQAYADGASEAAWEGALAAACAKPHFGTPIEHLAEHDLVVWALPNDPGLVQLPTFLDGRALARHLPRELTPDPGTALLARIIRHRPSQHCTARFELTHDGERGAFFGKCYAGERWRDARDRLDRMWRQSRADKASFAVGKPLGCSHRIKALWQAEVSGTPLIERLAGPQAEACLAQLAAALHRFQATGPDDGSPQPTGAALSQAQRWRDALVSADARFVTSADAVLHQLRRAPPVERSVPVHGDFHVDQMLWSEGRIALFDYDSISLGSPSRDLADFISQLLTRSDKRCDHSALAQGLLSHFRRQSLSGLDPEEFEWQLRLMLLRKAFRSLQRSRPGWHSRAMRALALAHGGLARLEARSQRSAA